MFSEAAYSFDALLNAEPALAEATHEGRESERICFRALAAATIHPSRQICYVFVGNLSLGGVAFLHPMPLIDGQLVELRFADGKTCSLKVRWVRKLDSYCFMMGCQFVTDTTLE